ncbi:putative anti-TRAP protein [Ochrobactrum phage vB_OspM_OC]|nr:putative anti-TRAP protein [Ochrobactrum phage vB_OspM_OC]
MASKRFKIVPKASQVQRKVCIACNGSGHYDHNGSPKCDSCEGSGYEE